MERMRNEMMMKHDLYPDLMGESSNNQRRGSKSSATKPKPGIARYGPIPGIEPGARFEDRKSCLAAGVHAVPYAGIHGSKEKGACSVCLSGGYEDDTDQGNFFSYTGTGGQRNSFSGDHTQIRDQSFDHRGNSWLMTSVDLKNPIRVVRGSGLDSEWAPAKGYRYDGLYVVETAYFEKGASGFEMCKFEFRRLPGQPRIAKKL